MKSLIVLTIKNIARVIGISICIICFSLAFVLFSKHTLRQKSYQESFYQDQYLKDRITIVDGKKHGPYLYMYPNHKMRAYGTYKENRLSGPQHFFFYNGHIQSTGDFEQDQREGVHLFYHPNGQIAALAPFINGKTEGRYEAFYYDGKPWYKQDMRANLVVDKKGNPYSGLLRANRRDETLLSESKYNEGKVHETTVYYPNGFVFFYSNPSRTVTYHANGATWWISGMEDNERHGEFISFDEQGRKSAEGRYLAGKLQGEQIFFYPNGQIRTKATYQDDLLDGERIHYDENGSQIWQENYKWGQRLDDEGYLYQGEEIVNYPNGNIAFKSHWSDGLKYYLNAYNQKGQMVHREDCSYGRCIIEEYYIDEKNKIDDQDGNDQVNNDSEEIEQEAQELPEDNTRDREKMRIKIRYEEYKTQRKGFQEEYYPNGLLKYQVYHFPPSIEHGLYYSQNGDIIYMYP